MKDVIAIPLQLVNVNLQAPAGLEGGCQTPDSQNLDPNTSASIFGFELLEGIPFRVCGKDLVSEP